MKSMLIAGLLAASVAQAQEGADVRELTFEGATPKTGLEAVNSKNPSGWEIDRPGVGAPEMVARAANKYFQVKETNLGSQRWYLKALQYERGEGVEKNIPKALELFARAERDGHPGAAYALGQYRLQGKDLPYDAGEALALFKRAAGLGMVEANYNVGVMYSQGLGTPVNYEAARNAYTKAADAGDPRAQFNLGVLLFVGKGGAPDPMQAWVWMSLAKSGVPKAASALTLVEQDLKPEQIALAKERVAKWHPVRVMNMD